MKPFKANGPRQTQEKTRASSTWARTIVPEARNELSLKRIVETGIALADRDGLAAVSIRGIAAQLGSSPMALYYYVPSKLDLLNLILDGLNVEFEWPEDDFRDWRAALSHFARESRRSLKQHPWASTLRAADPEYGPECIRTLESLLKTLTGFGIETRTATRALGVLFVFVNGFVAAETSDAGTGHLKTKRGRAIQPRFSKAVLASGKFPHVARFVEMGTELPDDDGFERALKWILDGIEADLGTNAAAEPRRRKRSA